MVEFCSKACSKGNKEEDQRESQKNRKGDKPIKNATIPEEAVEKEGIDASNDKIVSSS